MPKGPQLMGEAKSAILTEVRDVLRETLQLSESLLLTTDTQLLGSIPELDSMAVVSVLTALEDRFGFTIEDDEISAETFATVGSLVEFVAAKGHR
jgi:acyl carrier protein